MSLEMDVSTADQSMAKVTIFSWLRSDEYFVEKDEVICKSASGKITFEVVAEVIGQLSNKSSRKQCT